MLKKVKKLMIGFCMIFALLSGVAGTVVNAASTDYTTWKQGDPDWGAMTLGDLCNMANSGCLITSIAIQMARSGVEDPQAFNPGVLRDRLELGGFITHNNSNVKFDGNLNCDGAFSAANSPNFYVEGRSDFHPTPFAQIASTIYDKMNQGLYAVVQVNYGGHWVAVSASDGNEVYINDPANSGKTSLRQYDGGIESAVYFRANGNGSPQGSINNVPTGNGTNDPQGCVDSITAADGKVSVRGWTFDRDSLGTALDVHVYIGGPAGSNSAEGFAIKADTSRPDVNNVFPGVGENHGFDSAIATGKRGEQPVYIYAINTAGGTNNPLIGSGTVNIPEPANNNTKAEAKKETKTAANDYASISDYNYPTSVGSGKCFSVYGKISSPTKIKKCVVGVYSQLGFLKTGRSWNPKAKSVDIKEQADNYVLFNKLKKGTYYYKVKVTNGKGTKTLVNKKFVVE